MSIAQSIVRFLTSFVEPVALLTIGIARIIKAAVSGGDVYDAKVILASDISDLGGHRLSRFWLSRLIASHPTRPRACHERAMVYRELRDVKHALSDFDRVLELDPQFPGAREWRARTLAELGEHRRAAEDWLRVLRDSPDGPPGMGVCPLTWADCAEHFAKAGMRGKAIELLEEYFAQYADRVTAYESYETSPMRLLARLLSEAGQHERAAELRDRARASPHRVPADV